MTKSPSLGRIVTFYSYKGGTGRSMAMANVAWILASNGCRVLAVDWDLEAPGLHRYFRPFLRDPSLASSDGVIDFFIAFADAAIAGTGPTALDDGAWFRQYADLRKYASALDWRYFQEGGRLEFVAAGRQDSGYSTRVNSFNWHHFYTKLGGGIFLEEVKRQLRETYDYVLIDSRTGVSDTSGICTVQMPDVLVACFTLNDQSIEGAANTMASAAAHRQLPSGESTLRILPVPTRIDDSEKERIDEARYQARTRLDRFLGWLDEDQIEEYWAGIEVPYKAFYAFEEVLAVFGDSAPTRSSMVAAMESLTSWITEKEVTGFPRLADATREEQLARFLRRRQARAGQNQQYVFFVSHAPGDLDSYGQQFVADLVEEVRLLRGDPPDTPLAFVERSDLGEASARGVIDALNASSVIVSLVSPAYLRTRGTDAAMSQLAGAGKPVLPVEWIPVPREAASQHLRQMEWFQTADEKGQRGVRNLLRLSHNREYAAAVSAIAQAVHTAASRPLGRRAEIAPVASRRFLVAIAAERKDVMHAHRPGRYGMRRRDWVPFQSAPSTTVAQLLASTAEETNATLVSFHRFGRWLLSTPRSVNEAAIVIVDPWTLTVGTEFESQLKEWLRASRAPVAVIVALDRDDYSNPAIVGQLDKLQHRLYESLRQSRWPVTRIAETPESLASLVASTHADVHNQARSLYDERYRWHPDDAWLRSGELTPCTLTIDPAYQADKRWREWGDPRVTIARVSDRVYLLPSKAAPPRMRTPRALKEQGGLARKKQVTQAFIEKLGQTAVPALWFYRSMSDGINRVHAYSKEYDDHLCGEAGQGPSPEGAGPP